MHQNLIRREAAEFIKDYLNDKGMWLPGETDDIEYNFVALLQQFKQEFDSDTRIGGSFREHLLASFTTDPDRFTQLRQRLNLPIQIPLTQVVSFVEALIADNNPERIAHYDDFFLWNSVQDLLRINTRFEKQMEDRRLHHFIQNQAADEYRSIVETVSNAIDFSYADGVVDVSISKDGYTVRDYGKGMGQIELFEKLLIPYASGTRAIDRAAIGKFGLGFYTVFSHLSEDGDRVQVKSYNKGIGYQLDFIYRSGEIYFTPSFQNEVNSGTEISVYSTNFDPVSAEETLRSHIELKRNATVLLENNYSIEEETESTTDHINDLSGFEQVAIKHSDIEESALLFSSQKARESTGTVSFLINGITVEKHKLRGSNVPLNIGLDFPYTASLPEARNEVRFDGIVVRSFESFIESIAQQKIDSEEKIRLFNAVAESLQFFAKRYGSNPKTLQLLFLKISQELKSISQNGNIQLLPDIPGIENIQVIGRVSYVSVAISGFSLSDIPEIRKIPNFNSDSQVLYVADFKEGTNEPTVIYKNVIILDQKVYEKHKDAPVLLNTYLTELSRLHEIHGKVEITKEVKVEKEECNIEYPLNLERPLPQTAFISATQKITQTSLFELINYPDGHRNVSSDYFSDMFFYGRMYVLEDFKKLLSAFLLGIDTGNITGLIQKEITVDEFLKINNLESDRDINCANVLVNSRSRELFKLRKVVSFYTQINSIEPTQLSSNEILSWFVTFKSSVLKQDFISSFSKETQDLLDCCTTPGEFWQGSKSRIQQQIDRLKRSSRKNIHEVVFLLLLREKLNAVKDLYEYYLVVEANTDIEEVLNEYLAIDWIADSVNCQPTQLGDYTRAFVSVIRSMDDPKMYLETVIKPLLSQFPYISRLAVFELLLASVDRDTMIRMNLSSKYSSWVEYYANRNAKKSDWKHSHESYKEKGQRFSTQGFEVLSRLNTSITQLTQLPMVREVTQNNQRKMHNILTNSSNTDPMRKYGGNEFRQLAPSRNIFFDPQPYLTSFSDEQLQSLEQKLRVSFNSREMSSDNIETFCFILQSSLRFAHLDSEQFAFALDLAIADDDYSPGLDVNEACMQPYLFDTNIFQELFENRWIFSVTDLNDFVLFWRTINKKSSDADSIKISNEHLKKLLVIFEALSYKSKETRESLLKTMQTASYYMHSNSYYYFRNKHINMGEVPPEIRPFVIYFRSDQKETIAEESLLKDVKNGNQNLLTKISLAKRMHSPRFIAAIQSGSIAEFVTDVTDGKNSLVSRRELIHAVNHLPTGDPYLFLRELLQNVVDVVTQTGEQHDVQVRDFYTGDDYVVEVSDPIGMSPETALADLIVPGSSSKNHSQLGQFGIGFLSVLKDAKKVEIVTDDGSKRTEIELLPVYSQSNELIDFNVRYSFSDSVEKGTTIRKHMNFSEGAIESAFLEDAVYRYSRYVDSKQVKIHHNEKQVNTQQSVLSAIDHEILGRVEVLNSNESALLQGSLFVCDLPEYLQEVIPKSLHSLYKKFGLVINVSKEVELLRTRNDIARKQLYIEHFKQVLPRLFIEAILLRYTSGSFDFSLIPYDFYWFDGSPAKSNWAVEDWIEQDANCINTGGVVDYANYYNEFSLLQLLVSIQQFEYDSKKYSLREIIILARDGKLKDFNFLPEQVKKNLNQAKSRDTHIRFIDRTERPERRISQIPVSQEMSEKSQTHVAFLWLVEQLTPLSMREEITIEYYNLPNETKAHASPYLKSKGWNLKIDHFEYEVKRLYEFLQNREWNWDMNNLLSSIFRTSTHEDTHIRQGSYCDNPRYAGWAGSHNSIFIADQLKIMGEVLYEIDVKTLLNGLKQFNSSYMESPKLLRELGYYS